MEHRDLFPTEVTGTPHPGWQIIEAARARGLTAALTLRSEPDVTVYLKNGEVYLAEQATAAPLSMRLQSAGVMSREQALRGVMLLNGVEHLGRLFERDATIDRHAVELTVEMMNDEVLTLVAGRSITSFDIAIYARHTSGIDRWQSAPAGPSPAMTDSLPMSAAVVDVAPAAMSITEQLPAFLRDDLLGLTTETPQVDDSLATAIVDEVAEAVRRALSAIDTAAQPLFSMDPDDFSVPQHLSPT